MIFGSLKGGLVCQAAHQHVTSFRLHDNSFCILVCGKSGNFTFSRVLIYQVKGCHGAVINTTGLVVCLGINPVFTKFSPPALCLSSFAKLCTRDAYTSSVNCSGSCLGRHSAHGEIVVIDARYQLQRLLGDMKTYPWFNPIKHWLPYVPPALMLNKRGTVCITQY
jgi:hypothetical protein